MNLRDLNKILEQINQKSGTSMSLNDLLSMGQYFNEKNMTDERKLRQLIKSLSASVGKALSEKQIEQIIEMVKQNKDNLKDPNKSDRVFRKFK